MKEELVKLIFLSLLKVLVPDSTETAKAKNTIIMISFLLDLCRKLFKYLSIKIVMGARIIPDIPNFDNKTYCTIPVMIVKKKDKSLNLMLLYSTHKTNIIRAVLSPEYIRAVTKKSFM
jgi:hypothetical protein